MDRTDRTAALGAIVALLLVGSMFAVFPATDGDQPQAVTQALRYGLAAIVVFAFAHRRLVTPAPNELVRLAAVAGIGLVAFNLLGALATAHADPATVGVVVGCSPLAFALTHPRARTLAAAVLVVVGAALITGVGEASTQGLALAAAVLACEVLFTLLAAPLLPRLTPTGVTAYATAIAAAALAVPAALTIEHAPSAEDLAAATYLALGPTVLAFVLWYRAVQRLGADRAGVLVGAMPVGALLAGVVLQTQQVTPTHALGLAIVAAGMAVAVQARPAAIAAKPRSSSLRDWTPGSYECSSTTPSRRPLRRTAPTKHRPAGSV